MLLAELNLVQIFMQNVPESTSQIAMIYFSDTSGHLNILFKIEVVGIFLFL